MGETINIIKKAVYQKEISEKNKAEEGDWEYVVV